MVENLHDVGKTKVKKVTGGRPAAPGPGGRGPCRDPRPAHRRGTGDPGPGPEGLPGHGPGRGGRRRALRPGTAAARHDGSGLRGHGRAGPGRPPLRAPGQGGAALVLGLVEPLLPGGPGCAQGPGRAARGAALPVGRGQQRRAGGSRGRPRGPGGHYVAAGRGPRGGRAHRRPVERAGMAPDLCPGRGGRDPRRDLGDAAVEALVRDLVEALFHETVHALRGGGSLQEEFASFLAAAEAKQAWAGAALDLPLRVGDLSLADWVRRAYGPRAPPDPSYEPAGVGRPWLDGAAGFKAGPPE